MLSQVPFSSNANDIPASYDLLFKQYIYNDPNIMCECKATMKYLCVGNCKQASLHCGNQQCNHSNKRHKLCRILTLERLTTQLGRQIEPHKIFLTKLFEIEERFIEDLRKRRKNIVAARRLEGFQDEEKVAIQQIYVKKNAKFSKGILINQAYEKLTKNQKVNQLSEEVKFYQKKIDKVLQQLNKTISEIANNYTNSSNYDRNMINSTLLSAQYTKKSQQIDFLMRALQEPKGFKLLFRASEHQFSASKFYEHCNKVKDVLVLVKTQYGKLIGGYNPYGWDNEKNGYTSQQQKKAFIFSVDLKQKMDLTDTNYIVYHNKTFGPTFGGGHDLYLSDSCNTNKNSYAYFPSSYNFTAKPYTKNQQSWTAFSGAVNGKNFNVTQYEVYQVIK